MYQHRHINCSKRATLRQEANDGKRAEGRHSVLATHFFFFFAQLRVLIE